MRYYLIDELLRRRLHPYATIEQIQARCFDRLGTNVSVRTLKDDMHRMRYDELLGYHAPIVYSHAHKGYFYSDATYSIHKLPVTSEELHAARFATALLSGLSHLPMLKTVAGMVEKLEQALKLSHYNSSTQYNRIVPEHHPTQKGIEFLEPCMEFISQNRAIQLNYQSFGRATGKLYRLHPYLLKEFRQRWYLLAFDKQAEKLKTYSLDRFVHLEGMEDVFRMDDAFDPELYFRYCYGITYSSLPPASVVLSFTGDSRHYVRTKPIHFSQQVVSEDDFSFTVSLLVQPSYELISDILSFGPACKVLAPEALKRSVTEILQEMMKNY